MNENNLIPPDMSFLLWWSLYFSFSHKWEGNHSLIQARIYHLYLQVCNNWGQVRSLLAVRYLLPSMEMGVYWELFSPPKIWTIFKRCLLSSINLWKSPENVCVTWQRAGRVQIQVLPLILIHSKTLCENGKTGMCLQIRGWRESMHFQDYTLLSRCQWS